MRRLLQFDSLLARTRVAWVGLGQLALPALGVHLAADRIDDHLWRALEALNGLGGRVGVAVEPASLPTVAAGAALGVEALVLGWVFTRIALTEHGPALSWPAYKRVWSVNALVLPAFWVPVGLAGAWVVGMAVEDGLAPLDATLGLWAGRLAALLAAWRLGASGLARALGALEPPARRAEGWAFAPLLLGVAAIAATHGLPWRALWP